MQFLWGLEQEERIAQIVQSIEILRKANNEI